MKTTADCAAIHTGNKIVDTRYIAVEYNTIIKYYSNKTICPDLNWQKDTHTSSLQGLYSLSGKTSYRKISWSLEAARFGFKLFQSLGNLAGTSAALLPRCLSNFRAIRPLQHPISRLRDFTRFGGKTSYRLVNRGPGELRSVFRDFLEDAWPWDIENAI